MTDTDRRDVDGAPLVEAQAGDTTILLRDDEAQVYAYLTPPPHARPTLAPDAGRGLERVTLEALERLGAMRADLEAAPEHHDPADLRARLEDALTWLGPNAVGNSETLRNVAEAYVALFGPIPVPMLAERDDDAKAELERLEAVVARFLAVAGRFSRDDFGGRLEDVAVAIDELATNVEGTR